MENEKTNPRIDLPYYRQVSAQRVKEGYPPYRNTPTNVDYFGCFQQHPDHGERVFDELKRSYPEVLASIRDGTFLDLGCGWGSSFVHILKKSKYAPEQFIHLDADKQVFTRQAGWRSLDEKLRFKWDTDLRVYADAHDLPLPDNSINFIYCHGMFGDIRQDLDLDKIAREINRVLGPQEYFFDEGFASNFRSPCSLMARLTRVFGKYEPSKEEHFHSCWEEDCVPWFYEKKGLKVVTPKTKWDKRLGFVMQKSGGKN